MKAAFVTNRGAYRQENQDALCVAGTIRTGDMTSPEIMELEGYPQLLTVIDGMGGSAGGALAAGIIAETLSEAAAASKGGNFFGAELCIEADEKAIGALLDAAARKMASAVRDAPEMAKMGAVAAGILIREKSALIFNCGDCRVYRASGGGIERLTREHSIVQALYEKGEIDEDGMRSHPLKNIVTSSVSPDNGRGFELYTRAVSRCEKDSFFICSDGVWEALDARRLTSWLTGSAKDSSGLFGDLSASGCRDNISFIWQIG
jgi:protein phosphatase